jgi:hypothetical protein
MNPFPETGSCGELPAGNPGGSELTVEPIQTQGVAFTSVKGCAALESALPQTGLFPAYAAFSAR